MMHARMGQMAAGNGLGRRHLMSVLGSSAAAAPFAARAQQTARAPRIGLLYPGLAAMAVSRIAALREGLRGGGYGDADRLEIIVRSADGDPARLAPLAADLVGQKVDFIVAVSLTSIRAVQAASRTMPIVAHDLEGDPVALGLVASLARPGGNLTGMFADFPDIAMKWLELLKQALPTLSSVAVLHDPTASRTQLDAVEAAGRLLNVKLSVLEASTRAELPRVFAMAGERRPDRLRAEPARHFPSIGAAGRQGPAGHPTGRAAGRAPDEVRAGH
jgi:putative ABC transport system substrate-binding protein